MKILKRSLLLIMLVISLLTGLFLSVKAYNLIPIAKTNGGYVTYRGTSIQATMPDTYVLPDTEFRAVWISNLVSDLAPYINEDQYKTEINRVFDTMEYYNINVMLFHIRMFNDALYDSSLNPIASYYSKVNFDQFDPLAWIISEAHRRGIEFHAWLNPYRVAPGGNPVDVAKRFPSVNPASKPENLLVGTNSIILDPGVPEVRDFLVDTCMEVIEKYDVDAIHFDDYFYDAGIDDTATRNKYNTNHLSTGDFRRQSVDLFIKDLSDTMRQYNQQTGRVVQLGIAPSGIYQNGGYVSPNSYNYDSNGNLTYPLGSNTSGFSHYDNYLYADTKKWIDNEWIDYILPQSYWALEHPSAGYADVMSWWARAVVNKKVNLYSGMGLYMAGSDGTASWKDNPNEAANQIQYASQFPSIRGFAIFSFQHIAEAYNTNSGIIHDNMTNVKNKMWYKPALVPEIRTLTPVNLPSVSNLKLSKLDNIGYRIDFNYMPSAKFYAIYRSSSELTYSSSELIDVIGNNQVNGTVSYVDETSTTKNYVYGIKPLSKTNTLGAPKSASTQTAMDNGTLIPIGEFHQVAISDETYFNKNITIKWDNLVPLYGGSASYEVYKSYDNQNWEKVTATSNPVVSTNSTSLQKLLLDSDHSRVYVKIRAFNRLSESYSEVYELTVVNKIGTITNLSTIGTIYAGNPIQFVWNTLKDDSDVTYKVQMSPDGDFWTDITTTDNPVTITGNNAYQTFTLPNGHTNYYYRVVATNNEGKTISTNLRLDSYKYIDNLNIKVNGQNYTGPISVDEFDDVLITWNNISLDGEEATYVAQMSNDMQNWKIARLFSMSNTLIVGNTTSTQKIVPDFTNYTLYVKIEANTIDGRSVSEIVEIHVNVSKVNLRYFLDNYYNQQNVLLGETGIFN